MENRDYSIHEFARISRTTKAALLHYDRIGLLSPSSRGKYNKYRYYSKTQLPLVNLIHILQDVGMSLDEIKQNKDLRSPSHMSVLFGMQIAKIEKKIDKWADAHKLLHTIKNTIDSASCITDEGVFVKSFPPEAIVMGKLNDYTANKDDFDALYAFYSDISEMYPGLNLNYPAWAFFSEEQIKKRQLSWPDRYYIYHPDGRDKKHGGLYVVGYANGGYGGHDELFERILTFIDENELEVCGGAYQEYLLNEVCIQDEKDFLQRIMIAVRKKK